MFYVRQINVRRHTILLEVLSKKVPNFLQHSNTKVRQMFSAGMSLKEFLM